jgi:repressor LexA
VAVKGRYKMIDLLDYKHTVEYKKMTLGEILKKARLDKKLLQENVGEKLGINRSSLSLIENGKVLPSYRLLQQLCNLYNLDQERHAQILGKEKMDRTIVRETRKLYNIGVAPLSQFVFVPIIDTIPCGRAINVTPRTLEDVDEYAPIPAEELANKTGLLGFRVEGESMIGRDIYDGDVIVIDPALEVLNGDLVVISVNDEVTLKEYHYQGEKIILKSANPDFPDITFPVGSNSVRIYGKVIKIMTLRDA